MTQARSIPTLLANAMRSNYQRVCKPLANQDLYVTGSQGDREHYFFPDPTQKGGVISSDQIVDQQLQSSSSRPLQILDLGTGNGAVPRYLQQKWGRKVVARGIAAESSAPPHDVIIYGNIESLSGIKKLEELKEKKIDVAFANNVLQHLAHPAKEAESKLVGEHDVNLIYRILGKEFKKNVEDRKGNWTVESQQGVEYATLQHVPVRRADTQRSINNRMKKLELKFAAEFSPEGVMRINLDQLRQMSATVTNRP